MRLIRMIISPAGVAKLLRNQRARVSLISSQLGGLQRRMLSNHRLHLKRLEPRETPISMDLRTRKLSLQQSHLIESNPK
mgnify:CR=1 FL=1